MVYQIQYPTPSRISDNFLKAYLKTRIKSEIPTVFIFSCFASEAVLSLHWKRNIGDYFVKNHNGLILKWYHL